MRDPVKLELGRIAERDKAERERIAAERAARLAKRITVDKAANQWLAGQRNVKESTLYVYQTFARKVKDWARENSVLYLEDVTTALLDRWKFEWSPQANRKDDRMGPPPSRTSKPSSRDSSPGL